MNGHAATDSYRILCDGETLSYRQLVKPASPAGSKPADGVGLNSSKAAIGAGQTGTWLHSRRHVVPVSKNHKVGSLNDPSIDPRIVHRLLPGMRELALLYGEARREREGRENKHVGRQTAQVLARVKGIWQTQVADKPTLRAWHDILGALD